MRLMKSFPYALSALALAAGTAFAGQSSTIHGSVESSSPDHWLSEQFSGPMPSMAEADVIYIYPVEVTEYYLLIPSESSEMPG